MNKLKNSLIDKLIKANPKSSETQMLLVMSKYQDENGMVWDVSAQNVSREAGISIQSFYNALYSLEEKEIISILKRKNGITVKLVDNDFSNKDFSIGYFNVAKFDFSDPKFSMLPGKAKLMYLYLSRYTQGIHYGLHKGYEFFAELLNVSVRTIRWYFYLLKSRKLLGIGIKRNKAYNYEMNLKITQFLKIQFPQYHENELKYENMKSYIYHNFKRYMPHNPQKLLNDIITIMNQKRAQKDTNFFSKIIDAIDESVLIITQQSGVPVLNAAHINKCLTRRLSMPH